jgi:DNA primase
MSTPGSFADTVKQQADIVRVIGDYIALKKAGAQNFSGLCPFHKEKTPSFSVHATRQFYHCFGCGVSGDVFSFVQKIENITFPEAVRVVAQKLGIALPKHTYSSPEEAREARQRGALLDMHERACAFFEEQLRRPEGANAREYLVGRGLDDKTIREFRIGYAPDSGFVLRDLLKRDFDEELLRASGLFSWKETQPPTNADERGPNKKPDQSALISVDQRLKLSALYSKFRDRIMFPIANDSGKVIAFTGRRLSADEKAGPKYLNSPETAIYSKSRVLFNLDKAREAVRSLDYAVLVEGQMDCIAVYRAGFKNVIASSGTAFTEPQARLLARFSRNIVVNFDPDTAGAAAAERSLALLVEEEFNIKVLTLEAGLDPDLFVRKRGADAYAAALRGSQKYFDYLIERARALHPPRGPEAKVKALNYLLPHLNRVPSRIVRDEIAADIAQKLSIDSAVLRQELKQATAKRSGLMKSAAEPPITEAERIIIRALAPAAPDIRALAPGSHEANDLRESTRAVLLRESLHEGLAAESLIAVLLSGAEATAPNLSDSERTTLASVLMREDEQLTPELLERSLEALRRRALERTQRALKSQIADAERKQDLGTVTSLLRQKQDVDKRLAALA